MLSKDYSTFLTLVRLGIGHSYYDLPKDVNWASIKTLADSQGLSAVVLDGIDKCHAKDADTIAMLPQRMRLEWIGEVMRNYEGRYPVYEKAIGSLAGFYNQQGFKMMVIKGLACSLDWPKPSHRPCGDIDIWQFGQQKEADAALTAMKGVKVDSTHHHHTVFTWQSFMVENHYDFINVHHHKSNTAFEEILKKEGADDSHFIEICGEKVYLPSPNLHALFLLKHTMLHFASEGITLRQLLDWGFFVNAHGKEVDWKMVMEVLDQFGMRKMFNIINAICVENFGFSTYIFPEVQFDSDLKERVLNEILNPEFAGELPKGMLDRVLFKIRRWKANEWKHKLCYNESMWSAFWSGIWNHLLKPSSI